VATVDPSAEEAALACAMGWYANASGQPTHTSVAAFVLAVILSITV
jgi:hypothetical protein